jgi:beta-phosphoglucomutase-like phosphatase (HAD superfamily)
VIDAVVFDLDGVLLDSEHVWDEVREELARERGGRWHDRAQADMMGMSSPERRRRISPSQHPKCHALRFGAQHVPADSAVGRLSPA